VTRISKAPTPEKEAAMLTAIIKSRKLRAIGSVMDVLPMGDYSEYMPSGKQATIKQYWEESGKFLGTAIEQHNKAPKRRRNESDRSVS
jgi:hypothetical protein